MYTNNVGDNPGTDHWKVEVTSDNGVSWEILEDTSQSQNNWVQKTFLLSNYNIDFTDQVQFRFIAEDINNMRASQPSENLKEHIIEPMASAEKETSNVFESAKGGLASTRSNI